MELDKNLIQMLKNEEPTIQDLRNIAKSLGLKLRRSMKKRDIVKEIRRTLSQENYSTVTSDHLQNNKRADVSSGRLSRILTKKSNDSTELCETYNNDRIVLMVVNPFWVYTYWDFSKELSFHLKKIPHADSFFMRVYDITNIIFDGSNANRILQQSIKIFEKSGAYFNVPMPDADYISEIGYYENNRFIAVLKSNIVHTPPSSPRKVKFQKWVNLKDKTFKQIILDENYRPLITVIEKLIGPENAFSSGSAFRTSEISKSGGIK